MSADMMIVCKEDNSTYDGNSELAVFIDETSMGEPHSEFGKWFQERYCGAPDIFAQLAGIKEHSFSTLVVADTISIEKAIDTMTCHESMDKAAVKEYIRLHVGCGISTENW
jgi:hypothetical protein